MTLHGGGGGLSASSLFGTKASIIQCQVGLDPDMDLGDGPGRPDSSMYLSTSSSIFPIRGTYSPEERVVVTSKFIAPFGVHGAAVEPEGFCLKLQTSRMSFASSQTDMGDGEYR